MHVRLWFPKLGPHWGVLMVRVKVGVSSGCSICSLARWRCEEKKKWRPLSWLSRFLDSARGKNNKTAMASNVDLVSELDKVWCWLGRRPNHPMSPEVFDFPCCCCRGWFVKTGWPWACVMVDYQKKPSVHSNLLPPPVRILTYVHLLPWFATCLTWPAKIRSPTRPAPESEAEPSKYRRSEACGRSATLRSGTGFGKSTTRNTVAHFCSFKNNLGASHGKFNLIGWLKQKLSPRPKTSSKWIMMPEIIKRIEKKHI